MKVAVIKPDSEQILNLFENIFLIRHSRYFVYRKVRHDEYIRYAKKTTSSLILKITKDQSFHTFL